MECGGCVARFSGNVRGTGCLPGVAGSPVKFATGKMPVPRWQAMAVRRVQNLSVVRRSVVDGAAVTDTAVGRAIRAAG